MSRTLDHVAPEDESTAGPDYTERLVRLGGARWKRVVDVQAPYRWNLRRLLSDQATLDVGCGLGRNLAQLSRGSVGVDHNVTSVEACLTRGLNAMTVANFLNSSPSESGRFDGLLAAHLIEHLPPGRAATLLAPYLPYLAPGATVVFICPQERGFASDPTHTVFVDQHALADLSEQLGLRVERQFSFPLPRVFGKVFTYNEFVTVARF